MYYKYLPIERLTYLDDMLLRVTQPGDLNDPFECRPKKPNHQDFIETFKFIGDLYSKNNRTALDYVNSTFTPEWLAKFYDEAYEKMNRKIGILSLSKNWDNSLMWSHYTNSHRGFCVGFNSEHTFFNDFLSNDKNTSKYTLDVVYSKERVKIPTSLNQPKLKFEPHTTKSVDWNYEEEVRMIVTLNSASKSEKKVPYDIFLFQVPHDAIVEIIMGVNVSESAEKKIQAFGNKNQIKIFKAKISDDDFNMVR